MTTLKHNLTYLFFLVCIIAVSTLNAQSLTTKQEEQIKSLMSKMSLEEKVGQMTQITLGVLMKDGSTTEIDKKQLRQAIVDNHVGSILNVAGHALSVDQWHALLTTMQDIATKETPNSIPIIYGIDAIHGANYTLESTLFPHNIGIAATRNMDLVKESAEITAKEVRASGIRWNFDPTMGLGRQPLWSRFEETYGEDVYIATAMSKVAITTYEKDNLKAGNAVAACMKHYLGYSYPQSGKDRTPAYIPENMLREYFLPPFREAVNAGVETAMINSGEVNGMPVHGSKYYLQDILRGELGFEGVTVSDWEDIKRLHIRHQIASSHKEAVAIAVNAGIDMSMVPTDYSFNKLLVELVNEKKVSLERIDEAVFRILRLKMKVGLFENPYPETNLKSNFGRPEYKDVALTAARESITLLKNKNSILPLRKDVKILLAGPAANDITALHSSWSYVWQGNESKYYPSTTLSLKQALENKIGAKNVLCNASDSFEDKINTSTKYIANNADKVDYIVIALGEKSYAESPGGIHNLELDENQINLAKAAIKTGKPVILLLAEGRPRVISSIEPEIDGILMLYRPGSEGAEATADILFGDYNPNGKLPFTYPRESGDVLTYDHKNSETFNEIIADNYEQNGFNPQWVFGHGLSYTTFAYSNFKINKAEFGHDATISISCKVTNTGSIAGKEAVELYSRDMYASITPSVRRLRRFKKISLEPGASEVIKFTLPCKELSFINEGGKSVLEDGDFELYIADQKASFKISSQPNN